MRKKCETTLDALSAKAAARIVRENGRSTGVSDESGTAESSSSFKANR
jgi:hypothetical protein